MHILNEIFTFWPTIFVESIILRPCCDVDLQSTDWNAESPFCRKKISRGFWWESGGNLDTEISCEPKKSRKFEFFFFLPKLEQLVLLRKQLWVFSAIFSGSCLQAGRGRTMLSGWGQTDRESLFLSSQQFTGGSCIRDCGPYKPKL